MVSLMKEAQTTKPEIQKVADQISQYFVPIVLVISILSFIIWIVLVNVGAIPDSWRNDEPPLLFVTLCVSKKSRSHNTQIKKYQQKTPKMFYFEELPLTRL